MNPLLVLIGGAVAFIGLITNKGDHVGIIAEKDLTSEENSGKVAINANNVPEIKPDDPKPKANDDNGVSESDGGNDI